MAVIFSVVLIFLTVIVVTITPAVNKAQSMVDETNKISREHLSGIRVLHAFHAFDYHKGRFEKVNEDLKKTSIQVDRRIAFFNPFLDTMTNGLNVSVYCIGAFIISAAGMAEKVGLFSEMVTFSSYALLVMNAFVELMIIYMDSQMRIPQSLGPALTALRKNGHKAFICSGRVRTVARDERLLALGFDGMISGCGTCVDYEGRNLFYYRIPKEEALRTVEVLEQCQMEVMLEGRDICYVYEDSFDLEALPEGLKNSLRGKLASLRGHYGQWEFSKLYCKTDPKKADVERARRELSDFYAFQVHSEWELEMVPLPHSKGTGIQVVCDHLEVSQEDTFCFGDSVNDVDMMEVAGTSIAMGNGERAALEAADYVTDTVERDGVLKALRHFGLI